MDKPDYKVRAKTRTQEFTFTDNTGNVLNASCNTQSTLDQQDFIVDITLEITRPEAALTSRLKLKRVLSASEAASMYGAVDHLLQLIQMREYMNKRPPQQGIEFSVDVFEDLKIGAIDSRGQEPAFFVELLTKTDSVRCQLHTLADLDGFKRVFQYVPSGEI